MELEKSFPLHHLLAVKFKQSIEPYKKVTIFLSIIGIFLIILQFVTLFLKKNVDKANFLLVSAISYSTTSWITVIYLMDISSLLKYYKSSWWSLSGCFKEVMCQDRKLLLSNLLWILGLLYPLAGNENIRNIDCAYAVLKEIHPAFAEIYFIIMTTYLYVTSIVVVALPATLFYSIWMQQSQFSKLAEYIDETLGVTVLVIDENYHNNVSEKLNFIIKRHVQLLGFFHKRTEYLSIKITGFLFGLCGGFLAISAAKGERIFLSIILISIVCMGLEMDTGATQAYENAHEAIFYAAMMARWESWNLKNRKTYFMFLHQTSQMNVFTKFVNVRVNRSFQLKFIYRIYSAVTFLIEVL